MLRLVLRSARAHWRRFVLTTVAVVTGVVLGVSFVVGSFVLTNSSCLLGVLGAAVRARRPSRLEILDAMAKA
jgi:hypothetical protein